MLSSAPLSSAPSPRPQSMNADLRRVTMETYWREVSSIEEEEEEEQEVEEERKSMDEVEVEEAWLTEAGLSSLVSGGDVVVAVDDDSAAPAEALLSTLTRRQAATVRRRLDNYNETLKTRNRQPIRDVRDVFTQPDHDSAERDPAPNAESPPSRYHTTTKTIRRSTNKVRPTLPAFVFDNKPPEHPTNTHSNTHTPTNTHSPTHSHTPTQSPTHTHTPTHSPTHTHTPTHSPTHTHSDTHSPPHTGETLRADWLLRDSPYSEGVAEHKRTGRCWDCYHGDDLSDLQLGPVSPSLVSAEDLSHCDLTRLGFISHIELSTFLQALGVQTKRTRPPRRRSTDGGVFSVPLESLLEVDRKTNPRVRVPLVFQKLLSILEQTGLETEGILRVPGSAARLKFLRRELDRCSGGFDWLSVRQVDAAGLLKMFIRELPTPLLTHTHLYRSVLGLSSWIHQVQALQLLVLLLPEANRDTLRALLVFLRTVVQFQDRNRMSLWNVSMVMAPNLFTHRHHGNKRSVAKQREEMEEAVGGATLVRLMVQHQDLLWTVPHFLLAQVRRMNQATNQKTFGLTRATRRLLRRRNHQDHRDQLSDLSEGVIRVQAPLHSKVSMAIRLDGQTRARDVVTRFDNSSDQHLYEVGGNICERRLHPDCLLLEVYRVNPRCDWLIKPSL